MTVGRVLQCLEAQQLSAAAQLEGADPMTKEDLWARIQALLELQKRVAAAARSAAVWSDGVQEG